MCVHFNIGDIAFYIFVYFRTWISGFHDVATLSLPHASPPPSPPHPTSPILVAFVQKKPTHAFYGGLVHRSLKVNKGIHKEEGRGMKIKISEHDHVCVQNKTIYPSQDTYIRHIMWSIKIEKWKLINVTPQTATK